MVRTLLCEWEMLIMSWASWEECSDHYSPWPLAPLREYRPRISFIHTQLKWAFEIILHLEAE